MSSLIPIQFQTFDVDMMAQAEGRVAIIISDDGKMGPAARRANRLTRGAVARLVESEQFEKVKAGEVISLAWPGGMAAEALDILILPRRPDAAEARKAGVALAKLAGGKALLVMAANQTRSEDLAMGIALRSYEFDAHKTKDSDPAATVTISHQKPDEVEAAFAPLYAIADGVRMTRDLTNEPANILTTTEFADRLAEMKDLGLDVEVLEEDKLEELGMRTLLSVGQGSVSPSKVVVMQWSGGDKGDAPLALVGKGVVFDTGGISLKPAGGMEDMTMDMGGAGVVAGVMHAIAKRKAKANVVGMVGLVENMPSGNAVRPGDVVTSMKGDTIEVINTDAEGRLVLCDVMWHAQESVKPAAMIDLATLTGACIIALGHENAAVYSNDDPLANAFLKAADTETEGAWRMPLGQAYDDMLKSPVADMKNVGGRAAGSITAAQFLKRFVKDETPWIHLDIAGVAHVARDLDLSPKGATGWGVRALDRLIADMFEAKD